MVDVLLVFVVVLGDAEEEDDMGRNVVVERLVVVADRISERRESSKGKEDAFPAQKIKQMPM